MTQQRLRITYRKTAEACELTSGALTRAWVDAFECAGMPLGRPEGSKRSRIEFGPPLPQGATGHAELVDVLLERPAWPDEVVGRLRAALPGGLEPWQAEEIGERLPSLHSAMRSACYRVAFNDADVGVSAVRLQVQRLLEMPRLDWEEQRGERLRRFDLRALVYGLEVHEASDQILLDMQLALSQAGSVRPSSVLAALEIDAAPLELVRTSIEVDRPRIALRAWRERGRFE